MKTSDIWVIKYKPTTIDEMILPQKVKNRWSAGSLDANALFVGPAGTGKSSLASILCKNTKSLFIDCSTNRGIDVIRDEILTFGTSASISKLPKTIHLDEVDGLTKAAQNSLKATMDKVIDSVRFVLTTNHPERLIAPLHSRFERTDFAFTLEDKKDQQIKYITRVQEILKDQGYKIGNDAMTYLLQHIFPDIRQTLILLYQVSKVIDKSEIITLDVITNRINSEKTEFYNFITSTRKEPEIFKYVMQHYSADIEGLFHSLGEPFLNWLLLNDKQPELVLSIGSVVHKYQYESSMTSYNPLLGLLSCCKAINSFFKTS